MNALAPTSIGQAHSTRAPRRDAALNREALLDSARLLLNRDPEASLEAIAAGAGLSRRAVYGHFATRDDLVAELQRRGTQRVIAALQPVTHPDSRVAIALIGARLWSEVENVRVMAQLAVRGAQRGEIGETLRPLRQRLLEIVTRGIDAGELRADIDARTLSHLIEGSALSVLDEAVRSNLSHSEGHRLVMLAGLAMAGLSWREASAIIDANAELALPGIREPGSSPVSAESPASAGPHDAEPTAASEERTA